MVAASPDRLSSSVLRQSGPYSRFVVSSFKTRKEKTTPFGVNLIIIIIIIIIITNTNTNIHTYKNISINTIIMIIVIITRLAAQMRSP